MPTIPDFASEEEEADFWDTHSSTDFFDQTDEVDVQLTGPQPRNNLIALRLDQETLDSLKEIAALYNVGYQTLLRKWIRERLAVEPISEHTTAPRK